MKLFANIKTFAADESGAVTVDWVVLTAAIVGLGIAVVASVRSGVGHRGRRNQRCCRPTVTDLGNLTTINQSGAFTRAE